MEITNDERVPQRLEQLQRRKVALEASLKQLVAEIEVVWRECGKVESWRKDLLKMCVRKLFDANTRSRNLARNYKRKKNVPEQGADDAAEIAAPDVESFAADSEFDPSTVEASPHEPRPFPVEPLPHRFASH